MYVCIGVIFSEVVYTEEIHMMRCEKSEGATKDRPYHISEDSKCFCHLDDRFIFVCFSSSMD